MGNALPVEAEARDGMAVQDRESFGMWHVTVVPADRSADDDSDGSDDSDDSDGDDDLRFESAVPRHR